MTYTQLLRLASTAKSSLEEQQTVAKESKKRNKEKQKGIKKRKRKELKKRETNKKRHRGRTHVAFGEPRELGGVHWARGN